MNELLDNKPVVKKAAEPMPRKSNVALFEGFQEALAQYKPLIQAVLPASTDVGRFCLLAENMLRKNPKLLECSPRSFWLAILGMAELHLEPVLGHCYPVPYSKTVTMQLGYQGMVQLARNSGRVLDIWADVVREGDEFSYTLGTDRSIHHVRNSKPGDKLLYAYACAKLAGNAITFEVLDAAQVEKRKKVSKTATYSDSMWVSWEDEAWKKTAVRALFKMLPKSVQMQMAVVMDDAAALGKGVLPMTAPIDELSFIPEDEPTQDGGQE